ncbi:hypothetical protein [Phyllobacterium meliloti]|uniref:hypothetical protein n=1 Tax=Phyllobacterium meliloti TaxID=555317 RepID=UPI001D1508AD|nr:hypothetical protein [Phyllobacterium sp. T1293]UGX87115.1 hypothetical protein LLE53_004520 [Phyllobacterium sp. T1293]
MKIKLKGRIGSPYRRSGDVVEYPVDQARRLIDRGYAEAVEVVEVPEKKPPFQRAVKNTAKEIR